MLLTTRPGWYQGIKVYQGIYKNTNTDVPLSTKQHVSLVEQAAKLGKMKTASGGDIVTGLVKSWLAIAERHQGKPVCRISICSHLHPIIKGLF